MAKNHYQEGSVIDWTNDTGAAIASGAVVVVGNLLGVALVDIPIAGSGSVQIDQVWTLPKVAGTAFTAGEAVIWDVSAGNFAGSGATPATGDVSNCVIAVEPAASAATEARIKLNVSIGTVT